MRLKQDWWFIAASFVFLGWCVYKVTEDDIKEMNRREELYYASKEESVEKNDAGDYPFDED